MNNDAPWTIKRLLDWTSEFFTSKEITQPRLAAEILLAESLDCQRIDLYTRFDEVPSDEQKTVFRDWIKRHSEGEPVAYLVGHREFYSLKFKVNSSVLIPRPETEHLVSETLDLAQEHFSGQSPEIIDVGTGSGIIAITLAKHLPDSILTAVDISPAALDVARTNAADHDLHQRIEFIESDLFYNVPAEQVFDFVVSNPPYIGHNERDTVAEEVKNYEPSVALFAPGDTGTTLIERLVVDSVDRLKVGGFLLMEISPIISADCKRILEDHSAFADVSLIKDLAKLDRILIGRRVE